MDMTAIDTTAATKIDKPTICCPVCSTEFVQARNSQKYCGKACQNNAARGPRNTAVSANTKTENRIHYTRAAWLCHDLYKLPPGDRLGAMRELIEVARERDSVLRRILSDPRLLGAPMGSSLGKLFPDNKNPEVKNIAKAADLYCRMFWGHGVGDVVYKCCSVPPTGEDGDVEGHAPGNPPPYVLKVNKKKVKPVAPEGFDYRDSLNRPACKGFLWLLTNKATMRKLRKLGGCPTTS
jgi:hypothetical protein